MHWHVVDGIATEGYLMTDAPALFAQLGIELLNRTAAPPPCAPPLLVGATGAAAPAAAVPAAAATALTAVPIAPTAADTAGAAAAVAGRERWSTAVPPTGPLPAVAPSAAATVAAASSAAGGAFSNECLLQHGDALQPPTQGAPTTFLDECPAWVVRTTDAVWRPGLDAASVNASNPNHNPHPHPDPNPNPNQASVNASLEAYFYEGWRSVSSFGRRAAAAWGRWQSRPDPNP